MSSGYFLDGSMIERGAHRAIDERAESRGAALSGTAAMDFRGRRHVVRVGNLSPSGAMIHFPIAPNIGEAVTLHLLDRGRVDGQVRWVRDGRVGLSLLAPAE